MVPSKNTTTKEKLSYSYVSRRTIYVSSRSKRALQKGKAIGRKGHIRTHLQPVQYIGVVYITQAGKERTLCTD